MSNHRMIIRDQDPNGRDTFGVSVDRIENMRSIQILNPFFPRHQ